MIYFLEMGPGRSIQFREMCIYVGVSSKQGISQCECRFELQHVIHLLSVARRGALDPDLAGYLCFFQDPDPAGS